MWLLLFMLKHLMTTSSAHNHANSLPSPGTNWRCHVHVSPAVLPQKCRRRTGIVWPGCCAQGDGGAALRTHPPLLATSAPSPPGRCACVKQLTLDQPGDEPTPQPLPTPFCICSPWPHCPPPPPPDLPSQNGVCVDDHSLWISQMMHCPMHSRLPCASLALPTLIAIPLPPPLPSPGWCACGRPFTLDQPNDGAAVRPHLPAAVPTPAATPRRTDRGRAHGAAARWSGECQVAAGGGCRQCSKMPATGA